MTAQETAAASVSIAGPASDDFTRSQHAVWASLPVSLVQAPAKTRARLAVIDGRPAGWLDTLADTIRQGPAGILVVQPAAGPSARDIRAVATAAASAEAIVAVQSTWAANPAVAPFARAVAARVTEVTLVDSVLQVDGLGHRRWADVLLDQLALMRAVVGPFGLARFAAQHEHGYTIDGTVAASRAGGGPVVGSTAGAGGVALSAVSSATQFPTARLAAYGPAAEAHLVVAAGDTAIPAAAWLVDPEGAVTQPTWYETASRASWRRLLDAVAERPDRLEPPERPERPERQEAPGEMLPDLSDLAEDAGLVEAITSGWQTCR
jgi:hypothetical protein